MNKGKDNFDYILAEYEEKIESGVPFYMEACDLMDIVDHYEKDGRDYDAEACLRFALHLHPDNEDVLLTKAYRLKRDGRWEEAEAVVRALPSQNSREVKMFYFEMLLNDMQPDDAERYLMQSFFSSPAIPIDYDVYVEAAELYLDYGFFERAVACLKNVPDDFSQEGHVAELRAEAFCELENYGAAEAELNKALDADPYADFLWVRLSEIQIKKNDYPAAMESCNYALAVNSSNEQAIRQQFCISLSDASMKPQLSKLAVFLKAHPSDYYLFLLFADYLYGKGMFSEALDAYRQANRYCPQDGPEKQRIVSGLSFIYARNGKPDLACECLSSIYPQKVARQELYFHLADVDFEAGKRQEAVVFLSQVDLEADSDALNVQRVAMMLCERQCFSEAEPLWQKVLRAATGISGMGLPYMAMGALRLRYFKIALYYMSHACATHPVLTSKLFSEIFPHSDVTEYVKEIEWLIDKCESGEKASE